MNLKIKTGTVGYNNKILVSDEKFSLGKNVEVNSLVLEEPVIPMPKVTSYGVASRSGVLAGPSRPWALRAHKTIAQQTQAKKPTTHEEEKIALVRFLTDGFVIWNIFQ